MSLMNIYAGRGTKVRFAPGNNGYPYQNEDARKVLELDQIYTVEYTEVGQSSSTVKLLEIPKQTFNTVLFERVQ